MGSVREGRTDSEVAAPAADTSRNDVHLVGRLGAGVREVTLPSGDPIVSFHLVVDRGRRVRGRERRPREPTVDTLACVAWSSRTRRAVTTASAGDVLEIEGSLRRRFRRAPSGSPVSFYEVEVSSVRRGAPRRSESVSRSRLVGGG